jgi:putative permease
MRPIRDWFRRTFSDPQVVLLTMLLLAALAIIVFVAQMVAPVIAAVIIAFLLDSLVERLKRLHVSHLLAVITVFVGFLIVILVSTLVLVPIVARQVAQFVSVLPVMINGLRLELLALPQRFPDLVTDQQISDVMADLSSSVGVVAAALPTYAGASLVGVLTAVVYFILVVLLVFFMIKDKQKLTAWVASFLPEERHLAAQVWHEAKEQVANYIRGKFWEIVIVGVVTWIVFALMGVEFAILLALMTGFSVLIPYIGAAVVTVPVAVVGFVQWGLSWDLFYLLLAYGIIQALDGNLLAPLLFSEVVDLHPVAIIFAILFFGGLWGFWGVFFAIPLATVVQAVLRAWPRNGARSPVPD